MARAEGRGLSRSGLLSLSRGTPGLDGAGLGRSLMALVVLEVLGAWLLGGVARVPRGEALMDSSQSQVLGS